MHSFIRTVKLYNEDGSISNFSKYIFSHDERVRGYAMLREFNAFNSNYINPILNNILDTYQDVVVEMATLFNSAIRMKCDSIYIVSHLDEYDLNFKVHDKPITDGLEIALSRDHYRDVGVIRNMLEVQYDVINNRNCKIPTYLINNFQNGQPYTRNAKIIEQFNSSRR